MNFWQQIALINVLIVTVTAAPLQGQPVDNATTAPADVVRVDTSTTRSIERQKRGTLKAYIVESQQQLAPGNLADAFIGDLVLENDFTKAVFARPEKPRVGQIRGGTLIDITRPADSIDYFNSLNTTGDVLTTAAAAIYTASSAPSLDGRTTATVTFTGFLGDADAEAPVSTGVQVTTTWTLLANTPQLQATTRFTNGSTQTVYLHPGDQIDWGEAGVFAEGPGFSGGTSPTKFVVANVDDFSLGYITSGTAEIEGYHRGRDSVVLAHGRFAGLNKQIKAGQASRDPDIGIPQGFAGNVARKKEELVPVPGTETRYVPGPGGIPVHSPDLVSPDRLKTVDGQTTVVSLAEAYSPFADRSTDPENRLALKPGHSFVFTRYLYPGNSDWTPFLDFAYRERGEPTGFIAGVVVENQTNKRLADAEVRVSGGPDWTGTGRADAVLQTTTRRDGSFTVAVPAGTYALTATAPGRAVAARPAPVKVTTGAQPQLTVLSMHKESLVAVAVSEAETETSSPLPAKITFISKPPYPTINFGMNRDVSRGVRNTWYLPQGAGVIPVTPGRYQVVISRGIEYDIIKQDITVEPGQNQTIKVALPHVMKGLLPGMISMDAGVVSNRSSAGYSDPQSRAIQAACEGVSVIISGDYNQVTDLNEAIQSTGLGKWVKAFAGMRFLLKKDDLTADVFAYPLNDEVSTAILEAVTLLHDLPPDIALSDLKKQFPQVIFEISRPLDPERGYMTHFPFDTKGRRFIDDNLPPPDFDTLQLLEGKKLGLEPDNYKRYMAMQKARVGDDPLQNTLPLTPTGSSLSRLPYGQEIGYPRVYLYTDKPLSQLQHSDIVSAIRGQHFLATNGPILLLEGLDIERREFRFRPGDIIDSRTTDVTYMRARVLAAPWVSLSGLNLRENGLTGLTVSEIQPHERVTRYPLHEGSDNNIYPRYFKEDAIVDGFAYSNRKTLEPVVPDPLLDFGGQFFPFAWTGPFFIDRDGDGKVSVSPPKQPGAATQPVLPLPDPGP